MDPKTSLDHFPLLAITHLNPADIDSQQTPKHKFRLIAVHKDINYQEVLNILHHPDWPRRPFNIIAKQLGLAKVKIVKQK